MEEAILNFHKQFGFKPEIVNADKLGQYSNYILSGMGGSHLATDIFMSYRPDINFSIHNDYGLPEKSEEFFTDTLLINSSYSGNTEEPLDFLEEGYAKGYNISVISAGGKSLDFAKKNKLPYIQFPDDGIQPRSALGYSIVSLAKMIGEESALQELNSLVDVLKPEDWREPGEELANSLKGKVPVIYTSRRNFAVAYNWKIKFNETGKIPAFYNLFPELNHNEMEGFDVTKQTRDMAKSFHFIFIKDSEDHSRVQRRMEVLEGLYEERGLPVTSLSLEGNSRLQRIFDSLLFADWAAVTTARNNDRDPEPVDLVEEFKKRL